VGIGGGKVDGCLK